MPGKYIRTASGIVPVKDWYVRTAAGIQKVKEAYIRTAAGIVKYYPGQTNTALTMVAGTSVSNIGYFTPPVTGSVIGSLTPNNFRGYTPSQIGQGQFSPFRFLFRLIAAATPPNTDAVWSQLLITGIFSDSAGASVQRTLLRTATIYAVVDATTASWTFDSAPFGFISGNSYAVTVVST